MQAMAPGLRSEPQAGHFDGVLAAVGAVGDDVAAVGLAAGGGGAGGRGTDPEAAPAAAPTGWRAGAPMVNSV